MATNTIITIGRQYGSGGKEVGIRVAKELGIPFYDKELLQEAAKESGLCENILKNFDEKPRSLLYSIAMDPYAFSFAGGLEGESLEQRVYLATFDTIRRIADQGPCVIIGRCADYALKDYPNHLSLFIHAPLEVRVQRICKRLNIDVAKKMNVDQGCVSKWESGETRPSRKYHKKLARLYGCTVDELLREGGE